MTRLRSVILGMLAVFLSGILPATVAGASDALYKQGVGFAARGELSRAAVLFQDAVDVTKDSNDVSAAREGLVILKQMKSGDLRKSAVVSYFAGTLFIMNGKYIDAFKEFKKLYKKYSHNPIIVNSYGLAVIFNGDFVNGIKLFERAIALDRRYKDAYVNAIYAYKGLKQPEKVVLYEQLLVDLDKAVDAALPSVYAGQVWRAIEDFKIEAKESPLFGCVVPKGTRVLILNYLSPLDTLVSFMPLTSKGIDKALVPDLMEIKKSNQGYGLSIGLDKIQNFFVLDKDQKIVIDTQGARLFWNEVLKSQML